MYKLSKNKLLGLIVVGLFACIYLARDFFSLFSKISLTGFTINYNFFSNLLIPTAVTSIIFSALGIITTIFLITDIKKRGFGNTFPVRGYLISLIMLVTIFGVNYYITLFPYGNIVLNVVSFILQLMIYGVILPYLFIAQLSYIILLLRGEIKRVQ
jgi:hypothetical protein